MSSFCAWIAQKEPLQHATPLSHVFPQATRAAKLADRRCILLKCLAVALMLKVASALYRPCARLTFAAFPDQQHFHDKSECEAEEQANDCRYVLTTVVVTLVWHV